MNSPHRLLIANDDHHLRSFLARALVSKLPHCAVECVGSFDAALDSVESNPPSAVIVDLSMGGGRGMDIVRTLRASRWGDQFLIIGITGERSAIYRRQLREVGADQCLTGPCNAESLVKCLARLAPRQGAVAS